MGRQSQKEAKVSKRLTKKTSPTKAAKEPKGSRKDKKDKKGQKKPKKDGKRPKLKGERAKNPYLYFVMTRRKDVISHAGIEDSPLNFERIAKALAAAWQDLSKEHRQPFEACAALDRSRRDLDQMKGAKLKNSPDELSTLVKAAVDALMHTPSNVDCSVAEKAATDVVKSMEALDARLSNSGRAVAAAGLRNGASNADVILAAGAVGSALGGRLTALIRKWSSVPASKRKVPKEAAKPKEAPKSPTPQAFGSGEGEGEGDVDMLRNKVVGMLMRATSKKHGQAHFETCKNIEISLYRQFGQNLKEYRQRARSLSVNLSRPENRLLAKVLDGSLSTSQLASLTGEELAPEGVRIEREMERQKYFREEVHLTAAPPKTKRDLYATREPNDDASMRPPKRRKSGVQEESRIDGPKATTSTSEAVVPLAESSGSSSSSSSSSSSDSDSDSESLWEDQFLALPIADQGNASGPSAEDGAGCGKAASSSPAPPTRSSPPAHDDKPDSLQFLLSMGFEESAAMNAFVQSRGNVEQAIALLHERDKPEAASSSSIAADTSSAPATAMASQPARGSPRTHNSPSAALEHLLSMGFEDIPAMMALEQSRGDLEQAIGLLLTRPSQLGKTLQVVRWYKSVQQLSHLALGAELRLWLLGLPLHRVCAESLSQLFLLASIVLSCSLCLAGLQERVLYVPGFRYTGWLALITSVSYTGFSLVERRCERDRQLHGSAYDYLKLSMLTMGGMYLTNFSLHYLSYPLRVVFKSSKLIPVMVLSVVYLKKRYTFFQYMAVLLLTAGVVVFTLGDAKGKALFDPIGIVFVVVGSLADAMAASYEEKRFFVQMGCSANEVVLYSNLLGSVWAVIASLLTGELLSAARHSADHWETVPMIVFASLFGYVAQSGVLLLIKHFGATVSEIVKSCRKVTTICVSFLVFGKPWNGYHMAGLLLFVASVSAERFGAGGSSRRFAMFLLTSSTFFVLRIFTGGFGPSVFSVVIDAGSSGTRLNIFRFDSWTMKLLDIDGQAQVFQEEEPGISDLFENTSALRQQMARLLDAAVSAVPHAQRGVTPLSLRATTSLEQLDMDQVQELMEGLKQQVSFAGFKDGGVQAMSGDAEAAAEWLTVNMLMSVFKPGMQGVRDPVAVMDLGGATLQMAYYLADHDVSRAKRQQLDAYVQRISLPFGSGNVHVYRHSYIGYGLITAKVKSFKYAEKAGFSLDRHPCLPYAAQASMRDYRTQLEAKGALDKLACAELVDLLLRKDLPCLQEPGLKEQFLGRASNPAFGNCSFAGVWAGPGTGPAEPLTSSAAAAAVACKLVKTGFLTAHVRCR
ncbi:pst-2 [Symbiodinium natans]|uniref:Pst-2 protein n=1 Tax=Symbiodinium natans TaxID=878477 RepID=A0A812IAI5_9DINO|nr:pst-2 [Symbiodinium natans]